MEPGGQDPDKIHSRALDPTAAAGGIVTVGNGPIAFKAAEVVDPYHVVQLADALDPADPPAEAVLLHPVVIVQGIAPELAVLGKGVGRTAGYLGGQVVFIKLEKLGFTPHVRAVKRHVDRHVADKFYAFFVGIIPQRVPLTEEQELQKGIEGDVVGKLTAEALQSVRPAQTNVLVLPFHPALHTEMRLERHKQGVVLKPLRVFCAEGGKGVGKQRNAALVRLAQNGKAALINRAVVHPLLVRAPEVLRDLAALEQLVADEQIQVDKIGIARKG